jgi:hypothetical protein
MPTPLANPISEILELMDEIGGAFVKHLVLLWRYADTRNRNIIREAFDSLFNHYDSLLTLRKQHPSFQDAEDLQR